MITIKPNAEPNKNASFQLSFSKYVELKYVADNEAVNDPSNVKTVVILIPRHCIELFICSKMNILTPSEPEDTKDEIIILHKKSIKTENTPIDSFDGVTNNTKDAAEVPQRVIIKELDLPLVSPIFPKIIAPRGFAIIAIDIRK